MVISIIYLLIILLIWLLKSAYISNTYFYETYILAHAVLSISTKVKIIEVFTDLCSTVCNNSAQISAQFFFKNVVHGILAVAEIWK